MAHGSARPVGHERKHGIRCVVARARARVGPLVRGAADAGARARVRARLALRARRRPGRSIGARRALRAGGVAHHARIATRGAGRQGQHGCVGVASKRVERGDLASRQALVVEAHLVDLALEARHVAAQQPGHGARRGGVLRRAERPRTSHSAIRVKGVGCAGKREARVIPRVGRKVRGALQPLHCPTRVRVGHRHRHACVLIVSLHGEKGVEVGLRHQEHVLVADEGRRRGLVPQA